MTVNFRLVCIVAISYVLETTALYPTTITEMVSGWDYTGVVGTKVTSSDGNEGDKFGNSISVCGSYAIIGTPYDKYHGIVSGTAYIYKSTVDHIWKFDSKLSPSNSNDDDMFGFSVSCYGNVTAIGAYMADTATVDGGSVHLYLKDNRGVWKEDSIIHSYFPEEAEYFGYSVAVSHDLVLVGAIGSSQNGPFTGIVYSYRRSPEDLTDDMVDDDRAISNDDEVPMGWRVEAVFYPAEIGSYARFGHHISADGSLIVVGCPFMDERRGAAYVYNRTLIYPEVDDDKYTYDESINKASYLLLAKLTAGEYATKKEFFGNSVGIHKHTIVVGQYMAFNDDYSVQTGAAHVFATHSSGKQLTKWDQVAILTEPAINSIRNQFGYSVGIRDNTVLVGTPGLEGYFNASVYVFAKYRQSETIEAKSQEGFVFTSSGDYSSYWTYQAVLKPSDRPLGAHTPDAFGTSIAINRNGVSLIGATESIGRNGLKSGAFYSFVASVVEGGGTEDDDSSDHTILDHSSGRTSKKRIFLLVIVATCVGIFLVCIHFQQNSEKPRSRKNKLSSSGLEFGQGSSKDSTSTENLDGLSRFGIKKIGDKMKHNFINLSDRVKNKVSLVGRRIMNPVGDSDHGDIDNSWSSRQSLFSSSQRGSSSIGGVQLNKINKSSSKRTTEQILATARAVASDFSHPNQEEVSMLLRTHEKDWITEEKFLETLQDLVY